MMWFRCEDSDEGLIIRRVYGDSSVVKVPAVLDGREVVGLADYCFSGKSLPLEPESYSLIYCENNDNSALDNKYDLYNKSEEKSDINISECTDGGHDFEKDIESGMIREISGDYLNEVHLPDSIKFIGKLCFYQCRKLEKITMGGGSVEIGSDAFMNCGELKLFSFRAGVGDITSARQILLQRTAETEIIFEDAAVLFPEYTEQYDLIGPAHIFQLNIAGNGFHARQCFENGVFAPGAYDRFFFEAAQTEPVETLCKMAVYRLKYPIGMTEKYLTDYSDFLQKNMESFLESIVRMRNLDLLKKLVTDGMIEKEHIKICLKYMTKDGWIEGVREVLGWRAGS